MVFHASEPPRETPATNLLSWLFDHCRYNTDRTIILDTQNTEKALSWAQIKSFVRKANAGFRSFGVQKGDCVYFMLRNNIYYMPLVYGCMAADAISSSSRSIWTAQQVLDFTDIVDPKYLVADLEFLGLAIETASSLGLSKSNIILHDMTPDITEIENEHGRFKTTNFLLQQGEADWTPISDVEMAKRTVATRCFTSGTTGRPKAVDISHYALIARINQWDNFYEVREDKTRMLYYMELGGIAGHSTVTTGLRLGYTVCVFRMGPMPTFIDALETLKPQMLVLDPGTGGRLMKALPEGSKALHSLRDIQCVGMAFPVDARLRFEKFLHPDCLMARPYGLTEIGIITAVPETKRAQNDPDSVGFTWPAMVIKLVDDDGQEIEDYDKAGEICIKSPTMFLEYYKNPSATTQSYDQDGWFKTGDIGYISASTNQWHLGGRKTELFKVNALAVMPEELEAALTGNSNVLDAAIAPVYTNGEINPKIKAYIVRRPETDLTSDQVLASMEGRFDYHMAINGGIEFVEKIPRNSNGKIMRHALI